MWYDDARSLRTDFTGKQETSGVQQLILWNEIKNTFIYTGILNKGKGVIDWGVILML